MRINELEKLLDISRANIRFYEKEGLLNPNRNSNGYRDYSDGDIAKLKKIILLRKIGIPIQDIKNAFAGETQVTDIINVNISELEKKITELQGALAVSKEIAAEQVSIDSMDADFYLNRIRDEENKGHKFNDILRDYLIFEKSVFIKMWKNVFFFNLAGLESKIGFAKAVMILLLICVVRGLMCQFVWHSKTFFEGFIYPFEIFAISSLILLPIYLIAKKRQ